MKQVFQLTAFFLILGISSALGSADRKPRITTNTLVGVWEAVSNRGVGIFQIEYAESGLGILIDVPYRYPGSFVYTMDAVNTGPEGNLILEFSDSAGKVVRITGKGYATSEGGVLEVELDKNPFGKPNIWKLKFIRLPEDKPYLQILSHLSRRASAACGKEMEQLKGRRVRSEHTTLTTNSTCCRPL